MFNMQRVLKQQIYLFRGLVVQLVVHVVVRGLCVVVRISGAWGGFLYELFCVDSMCVESVCVDSVCMGSNCVDSVCADCV